MIKTNLTGVYFRETQTNNKPDKTYYITYKDNLNKKIWLKIGNYSQGIREAYCNQKRNEILTKQRNGEEPPIILQKKKRTILSIETLATEYFKGKNINGSTFNHYKVHILPYFIKHDIDLLDKKSIEAKKDERLTSSGNLIGFNFYHTSWGLTPPTAFYDWLYINTLNSHKELHSDLLNYNAFTDIEFNPKKSLNCQAYSVAMFVSIYKRNLINLIKKPNSFLKLYSDYHVSNTVNENKKFILQRNLF